MPHKLLELLLNDLHLLLLMGIPHDQLSCFSSLPLVNARNGASARFLI
jgi:hypothetical protein